MPPLDSSTCHFISRIAAQADGVSDVAGLCACSVLLQENTQPCAKAIYAFDVVAPAPSNSTDSSDSSSGAAMPRLANRRVFAVSQSIKPDGIKVDSNGNGEPCRMKPRHVRCRACHAVQCCSL
eukprot:GHRQ01021854.1.p2 GENE.GHRQ01021854.1~~GHRQ01021854.1.p2  ORF type:complete len:123 (-),score=19.34 GHRQ01021854.1:745-1113(-)